MTFPLINYIYDYNGQKTIIWQQDLFRRVYLRSIPENGGSLYERQNWWKFMFKAKRIEKAPEKSQAY